jgi:hypothetical protein
MPTVIKGARARFFIFYLREKKPFIILYVNRRVSETSAAGMRGVGAGRRTCAA